MNLSGAIRLSENLPFAKNIAGNDASEQRTILGLNFFIGTAESAVAKAEAGGLVVIPAAPALKNIATNRLYREALLSADTVLADSSFMVLAWNFLTGDSITRLSGLTYMRQLLKTKSFKAPSNTLWVLPTADSVRRTRDWLQRLGIEVPSTHFYVAPMYQIGNKGPMDPVLAELANKLHPQHILLGVGGGVQEPLGADLKRSLNYGPAIHCTGAAIAFLTGEQIRIPVLADKLCLGWLLRTSSDPVRHARRYWDARKLFTLLRRYRDRLPELMDPLRDQLVAGD